MMSLNRALVEFYVQNKLSEHGCSVEEAGIRDTVRTDPAHIDSAHIDSAHIDSAHIDSAHTSLIPSVTDSAHTHKDPAPSCTDSAPSCTDPAYTRTDSALSRTDPALTDRTQRDSNSSVFDSSSTDLTPPPPQPLPSASAPPPAAGPSPSELWAVQEALRDSGREFELRFSRAFSDLHRQLHITPATAYHSFESVMDEVFRDGVNWGRVIGLFAFGGALCVECVDKEMSPLVSRIMDWMTVYLDEHIQDWIDQQGGWTRFAQIYGNDAAARGRKSEESVRKWLLAGVTLVTGVVVGSLLAQRRL